MKRTDMKRFVAEIGLKNIAQNRAERSRVRLSLLNAIVPAVVQLNIRNKVLILLD